MVLHHLAQAAAVILLVELIIVLTLFLGVAGGLAFGLHWVHRKTNWVFDKANGYVALVPKYTQVGTDLVAKPFIVGGGSVVRVVATLEAIRRQVRQNRMSSPPVEPVVASRPIDPETTLAVPSVSDTTVVLPRVTEPTIPS